MDMNDDTFLKKTWIVIKLAVPAIICTLMYFLQEIINIYYVSHLNSTELLSAVGLGNLIQNAFITACLQSFNSVLETLVSQAAGSGNLQACGIYLNRAILVMTMSFSLLLLLILNSKEALMKLGQSPKVCQYTQNFLITQIPALYLYGYCDLYRKFLCCF